MTRRIIWINAARCAGSDWQPRDPRANARGYNISASARPIFEIQHLATSLLHQFKSIKADSLLTFRRLGFQVFKIFAVG